MITMLIVFISLCFEMRDKLIWPFLEYWINVMMYINVVIVPWYLNYSNYHAFHCCRVLVMQIKLTVVVVDSPTWCAKLEWVDLICTWLQWIQTTNVNCCFWVNLPSSLWPLLENCCFWNELTLYAYKQVMQIQ